MTTTMLTKPALHTAGDLKRLSAQGHRYELVRGELREVAWLGGTAGSCTSRLAFYASAVAISQDLGVTFATGTGFLVERNPDTVIAPDFAFVAKGRLPTPLPDGYVAIIPDIVLETRSASKSKKQASAEVVFWLELGVKIVWKMNPNLRLLTTYRANWSPLSLDEGDTLDGEDVLPGLSVPIARLFL